MQAMPMNSDPKGRTAASGRFPLAENGRTTRINGTNMGTRDILDLIGHTPLIQLKNEAIFAKAEFLNPGGSIKDRIALAMIDGADRASARGARPA